VPASGKTTAAKRLQARLMASGRETIVVREAAEVAPFPRSRKRDWRFNAWTLFNSVSELMRLEADSSSPSAIFDRGLFDAAAWIRWHLASGRLDGETADLLQSVCLFEPWQRQVDAVFLLEASFDAIVKRRGGRVGRIVNTKTIGELSEAYASLQTGQVANLIVPVFVIPTDERSPEDVERAAFEHVVAVLSKA
jgi:hypothetical protein